MNVYYIIENLVSHEAIIKPPKNTIAELFNVAFANILCEN